LQILIGENFPLSVPTDEEEHAATEVDEGAMNRVDAVQEAETTPYESMRQLTDAEDALCEPMRQLVKKFLFFIQSQIMHVVLLTP
jgi:hypothetical protein